MCLHEYTIDELFTMKLIQFGKYKIGYALKNINQNDINIIAVHNNEKIIKNILPLLIQSAIRNGGNCCDHFDIPLLSDAYQQAGLVEYKRVPYNPTYDPKGLFLEKYGALDVIYRKIINNL